VGLEGFFISTKNGSSNLYTDVYAMAQTLLYILTYPIKRSDLKPLSNLIRKDWKDMTYDEFLSANDEIQNKIKLKIPSIRRFEELYRFLVPAQIKARPSIYVVENELRRWQCIPFGVTQEYTGAFMNFLKLSLRTFLDPAVLQDIIADYCLGSEWPENPDKYSASETRHVIETQINWKDGSLCGGKELSKLNAMDLELMDNQHREKLMKFKGDPKTFALKLSISHFDDFYCKHPVTPFIKHVHKMEYSRQI